MHRYQNRCEGVRSCGRSLPDTSTYSYLRIRASLSWRMWIVFRPILRVFAHPCFDGAWVFVERLGARGGRDGLELAAAREPPAGRPLGVELAQERRQIILLLDHRHGIDGVPRGHPLREERLVARIRVDERAARHGDPAADHGDRDLAGRDLRTAVPELRPELRHLSFPPGFARGLATPWLNAP